LAKCPLDIRQPGRCVGDGSLPDIYFERWASLLEIPIEDEDGETWWLFPKSWEQEARAWVAGKRDPWNSGWIVYADSRAFVWTCAIVEGGGGKLQEVFPTPLPDSLPTAQASAFGHWIKLLNVDYPKSTPTETYKGITKFEQQ